MAEELLGCRDARSRDTLARLGRDAELAIAPEEANDAFGGDDDGQLQIVLRDRGEKHVE